MAKDPLKRELSNSIVSAGGMLECMAHAFQGTELALKELLNVIRKTIPPDTCRNGHVSNKYLVAGWRRNQRFYKKPVIRLLMADAQLLKIPKKYR